MVINKTYFNMNLTEKKEELIKHRADLERAKKVAHDGILAVNAKLRKLESVSKHAEEIFGEDKPAEVTA